jgi:hypothetical protein
MLNNEFRNSNNSPGSLLRPLVVRFEFLLEFFQPAFRSAVQSSESLFEDQNQ